MKELNNEQLGQVSGGVAVVVGDTTNLLMLAPGEFFFLVNAQTGNSYMFGDNGDVLFMQLFNDTPSSFVTFPFEMVNNASLCEYSVPSSLFN